MSWSLTELIKGEAFPDDIYWPDEIEAFVPLPEETKRSMTTGIDSHSVQVFGKDLKTGETFPLVWLDPRGVVETSLRLSVWVKDIMNENYRPEHERPITALLPFHYHNIPPYIRNLVLSFLVKAGQQIQAHGKVFPVSFLNGGAEILLSLFKQRLNFPFKGPMAILSHDIDTVDGFRWMNKIAVIEEECGFKSLWNIVPSLYKIDEEAVRNILKKGHEIGMHGIWHDNKEAFLEETQLKEELEKLKDFFIEYNISAYRSPSWCRTQKMFKVLSEYFDYDLSCIDNDLICPCGSGGVGFMRPFILEAGLLELPCTIPYEAPLFFGTTIEELNSYWQPKVEFIKRYKGLLLINTHPDSHYLGNDKMLKNYREFLSNLRQDGWTGRLPRELI